MIRLPFELAAYRALTRAAFPAAGLIVRYRARRGKEEIARRGERFGIASIQRPPGLLVWVHAASVGETVSVLPLIDALCSGSDRLDVLLTTGTVTSATLAAQRLPEGARHQYVPLDSPRFVSRFLEHWQPSAAIFTEQELWPNLLFETSARGIPIALVNARMSTRSFERWQRRSGTARSLMSRLSIVLAQNTSYAEQYRLLGAPHVVVAGNLKIDAPPPPVDPGFRIELEQSLGRRPRLLAASTHGGEEAVVAEVHRRLVADLPGLCTIIAPRHPERGAAIAAELAQRGLSIARRSQGGRPAADTDVYLVDTIGELGTLYSVSPVAFVGGSLIPHGGQNPIEAVRHGAVVITGPSWTNFGDAYRTLLETGGAVEIQDASSLATASHSLLTVDARRDAMRLAGAAALSQLTGALTRTLDAIAEMLSKPTAGDQRRAAH
jgi:3-deoxy-D-manno-octulosonic-acid transferase